MADQKLKEPPKRRGDLTEVAEDQNWRSYVSKENMCAERWSQDWGFLAGSSDSKYIQLTWIQHKSSCNALIFIGAQPIAMSRTEKIAQLEEELKNLQAKSMVTSNNHYGTGLRPKAESATYHTQTFMNNTVNKDTLKRA